MALIGSILIGMRAEHGKLKKDLTAGQGHLKKFGNGLGSAKKALLGFGAALGAGLVINGLKNITKESFQTLDRLGKFSDEMGLTVTEMRAFQLHAVKSGSDVGTLEKGIQRAVRRLGEARQGFGEGRKAIEQLGLSAEELTNMSTGDALITITQAISEQEGAAMQASAAYGFFGKQGLELLGVIRQGKAGFDAAKESAEKFGNVSNRLEISHVEKANDAIADMSFLWESVGQRIAIGVAPIITALVDQFNDSSAGAVSMADTVTTALEWIVSGIAVMADVIHTVKIGWKFFQVSWTAQIAIMVKGLAYLAEGLQELINLIPGVETTFGDTFQQIGDGLLELTSEQWDDAMATLIEEPPSTGIKKFFNDVVAASKIAADELGKNTDKMSEDQLKLIKDSFALVESLTEQRDTFGMTSTEAKIYKLEMAGASKEILDQARSIQSQIDALEESKKQQEEFASQGKSVFDSTRTELEKYDAEVAKLKELFAGGFIDEDTFNRAIENAKANLPQAEKSKFGGFAGAALAGSAEARTSILNNRFGGEKPLNAIAQNTKQQLAENKKQTTQLEKIADKEGFEEFELN